MPDQVKSEAGAGVLKEILLDDMSPWEMQPRKHFCEEKHKRLMESVRMHGVIQPLIVRMVEGAPARGPMPSGNRRYQIIAGERRWRAAREAQKKAVLCVLRDLTDAQALEVALVENMDRHDLDVFEEAEGYHGLIELGWSVAEVAERFSRGLKYIYSRLALRELGEKERDAVRDGSLPISAAVELSKVPVDARERALDEVLHPKYSEEPMGRDAAVRHIRQLFVRPAEDAAKWEAGRKDLERQFPGAEVPDYAAGKKRLEYGSGWVSVSDKPKSFEVVERLRSEPDGIPCWGDLAEKYGAPLCIAPGEDEEAVIRLVERKVIIDGDIVNARAGECVFPKPRGEDDERKERLAETRKKESAAAREVALAKETKAFLEELRNAGIDGIIPSLVKLRTDVGRYAALYNAIHGTTIKGWDDGDLAILTPWAQDVVKKGGLRAWLWLEASDEIIAGGERDLSFADVAHAAGMKPQDWPLLCGEGEHD